MHLFIFEAFGNRCKCFFLRTCFRNRSLYQCTNSWNPNVQYRVSFCSSTFGVPIHPGKSLKRVDTFPGDLFFIRINHCSSTSRIHSAFLISKKPYLSACRQWSWRRCNIHDVFREGKWACIIWGCHFVSRFVKMENFYAAWVSCVNWKQDMEPSPVSPSKALNSQSLDVQNQASNKSHSNCIQVATRG